MPSPLSSIPPALTTQVEPASDRDRFPDPIWAEMADTRQHLLSIVRDRGVRTGDRIQAARAHIEACKSMAAVAGGIDRGMGKEGQAAAQAAGEAYAATVMSEALGLAGPAPAPWVTPPGAESPRRGGT